MTCGRRVECVKIGCDGKEWWGGRHGEGQEAWGRMGGMGKDVRHGEGCEAWGRM